jgi:hypothetical protein
MSDTNNNAVVVAAQAVATIHNEHANSKIAFLAACDAHDLAIVAAESAHHTADPNQLVDDVEATDLAKRRAATKVKVDASRLESAKANYAKVVHDSLEAPFNDAKAQRLEGCRLADEAREMMSRARATFDSGTASMQRVHNQGRRRGFDGQLLSVKTELGVGSVQHVPSVDEELALFASARP